MDASRLDFPLPREFFSPYRARRRTGSPIPRVIGYNHCPPEDYAIAKTLAQVGPIVHVEWVVRGALRLAVGGQVRIVGPGEALLLLHPIEARYQGQPSAIKLQTLWFYSDDVLLHEFLLRRLPARFACLPALAPEGLEGVLGLFRELRRERPHQYDALHARCHDFWRQCLSTATDGVGAKRPRPRMDASVLTDLAERSGDPIRIAHLARHFGFSREHFSREFRRVHGVSPRRRLIALRLTRLEELLASTNLSTRQASAQAGFPSYPVASRLFRETHGLTMDAWRHRAPGAPLTRPSSARAKPRATGPYKP